MDEKKFEHLSEIISTSCQTLFGFKRNGQPRSVLDVATKIIKMKNKEKRKFDEDLYECLKPDKKKDKKKKKKNKKKNKKK